MQSMTGYGKETSRQGDWEMTVELRAVNHRFLDLSMRLGRGLTFLEETIRKTLAPLCRGHVTSASRVLYSEHCLLRSFV